MTHSAPPSDPLVPVTGYCFRCKAMKDMNAATETRMKNGKRAFTGTCITCGTKMFKIGAQDKPTAPRSHAQNDGTVVE